MELIEVRLIGMPVALHQSSVEHGAEVMREFSHLLEDPSQSHAPARLISLFRSLREKYRPFSLAVWSELDTVAAEGQDTADVTFTIPREGGEAAKEIVRIWEEVDRYCQAGDYLLALQPPPQIVAYRKWFLEQISAQAGGQDPVSWEAWLAAKEPS